MTGREHKAHVIAASGGITLAAGSTFLVRSMRDRGQYYLVNAGATKNVGTCSCPDAKSDRSCKHILAIWIAIDHFGLATINAWEPQSAVPSIPFDEPKKRKRGDNLETFDDSYASGRRREPVTIIYPDDEPTEMARRAIAARATPVRVPELAVQLADLAGRRRTMPTARGGQQLPMQDQLFCVLMKAYNNCSYEELMGQLHLYRTAGHVGHVPSRGSLVTYQHSTAVNEALKEMLEVSALPVREIETMIAIDGTGFGTCSTANSRDEKYRGVEQRARNRFMTAVAAVGCATNMVVSAGFSTTDGAEIKHFERLIPSAKALWPRLRLVLGDALYSDNPRIEKAAECGMRLISPTRYGKRTYQGSEHAQWLWEFFNEPHKFSTEIAFDDVYRYRSKIESVFSAVKRTMGWHLRMRLTGEEKAKVTAASPNDIGVGRENELLARFIVWNLRVLVVLEQLHDQQINFALDMKFRPFALERFTAYHPLTGLSLGIPDAA